MTNDRIFDPKQIRLRLGLNQQEFWAKIGVSQCSGSRYERGRRMPIPVREMLRVVHIEGIDLSRINRGDIDALDYLKANQPESYKCLRQERVTNPDKTAGSVRGAMQPTSHSNDCPLDLYDESCPQDTQTKCRNWWGSLAEKEDR